MNWCIGGEEINKIVELCKEILESKTNYLMTKADEKTALYNKEILAIQNDKLNSFPPDMDRWLALLASNELYNAKIGSLKKCEVKKKKSKKE